MDEEGDSGGGKAANETPQLKTAQSMPISLKIQDPIGTINNQRAVSYPQQ